LVHYAAAWGLVHFLIHADDEAYRKPLSIYFRALQHGVDPLIAFRGTIGRKFESQEDLRKRWSEYILALEPARKQEKDH
jgi:hypothetical protein